MLLLKNEPGKNNLDHTSKRQKSIKLIRRRTKIDDIDITIRRNKMNVMGIFRE